MGPPHTGAAPDPGMDGQGGGTVTRAHGEVPEPQEHIYAVVNGNGLLETQSASGRWAFRTLQPAHLRAHHDRQAAVGAQISRAKVARYKFDGWA